MESDSSQSEPDRRPLDAAEVQAAYDELRGIAAAFLRHERADHTLQPTALVNEAWLKVCGGREHGWRDQAHFCAVAATAMRQILVDHARTKGRQKRGGGWVRVTLSQTPASESSDIDILALDEAMTELEAMDARKSRVVELRFFGGLTNDEAAAVVGVAAKTAEADWYMARAWLRHRLREPE